MKLEIFINDQSGKYLVAATYEYRQVPRVGELISFKDIIETCSYFRMKVIEVEHDLFAGTIAITVES